MIDYARIIRTIREDSNLSRKELAKECGVSVYTIKAWENGYKIPNRNNICLLFKITNNQKIVNMIRDNYDYMFIDQIILNKQVVDNNRYSNKKKTTDEYEKIEIGIPVYDIWNLTDDFDKNETIERILLPLSLVEKDYDDYFAIEIDDDSMADDGINEGDFAIFEKTDLLNNNEIGMFIVDGNAYCRKYTIDGHKTALITKNDDYDCYNGDNCVILGKLTSKISKY